MGNFLKQSTAACIMIGPLVSNTDGFSPCNPGFAASNIYISKNGATFALTNANVAPSSANFSWFKVVLDATDTNAVGDFLVTASVTGALPVWREFTIINASSYDAIISGNGGMTVKSGSNSDKTGYVLSASSIAGSTIAASTISNGVFALTAASQIWNAAVRELSDKVNFGLSASALTEISVKSASGVWNNADRIVTGGSVVATSGSVISTNVLAIAASAINASTIAASAINSSTLTTSAGSVIWNSAVRTLSDKVNYGLSASALDEIESLALSTASSVWTYETRNLTDKTNYGLSGSALSEISSSVTTASNVWDYTARTLTDKTNYGLSGSALSEISSSLSGTGISASEIWNYVTREVTGGSVVAVSGSVTAVSVTDKTEYSLSTSGLNEISIKAASGVWNNDDRIVTGGSVVATSGSVVAITVNDKLNYGLSGSALGEISSSLGGISLTSQQIWEYSNRSLSASSISSSTIAASAIDGNSFALTAASQVWNAAVRTITGGGTVIGSGSETVTITVTHEGNPEDNAGVWVSTDIAGSNVVAGTLYSNMSGQVTFYLDIGSYYVWVSKAGINFGNPTLLAVT